MIVITTSKHSFRAQDFVSHASKIEASMAFLTSPSETSIPKALDSRVFAYILARTASALRPPFSARVLGTTSNATPNFSTAYWSRPGCSFANFWICYPMYSSVAPAPATHLGLRIRVLTVLTPLSTARSVSSSIDVVEPRRMIVAILFSS